MAERTEESLPLSMEKAYSSPESTAAGGLAAHSSYKVWENMVWPPIPHSVEHQAPTCPLLG